MKSILALAFGAGLLLAGSGAASAMMAPPAPHSGAASIIQVRDGCGRGYHENRRGRCVLNDGDNWGGNDWRHRDRDGDGCDRWHHRNRWGRCVRNF